MAIRSRYMYVHDMYILVCILHLVVPLPNTAARHHHPHQFCRFAIPTTSHYCDYLCTMPSYFKYIHKDGLETLLAQEQQNEALITWVNEYSRNHGGLIITDDATANAVKTVTKGRE